MKNEFFITEDKRPDKSEELSIKAWEIAFQMEQLFTEGVLKAENNSNYGTDHVLSE